MTALLVFLGAIGAVLGLAWLGNIRGQGVLADFKARSKKAAERPLKIIREKSGIAGVAAAGVLALVFVVEMTTYQHFGHFIFTPLYNWVSASCDIMLAGKAPVYQRLWFKMLCFVPLVLLFVSAIYADKRFAVGAAVAASVAAALSIGNWQTDADRFPTPSGVPSDAVSMSKCNALLRRAAVYGSKRTRCRVKLADGQAAGPLAMGAFPGKISIASEQGIGGTTVAIYSKDRRQIYRGKLRNGMPHASYAYWWPDGGTAKVYEVVATLPVR